METRGPTFNIFLGYLDNINPDSVNQLVSLNWFPVKIPKVHVRLQHGVMQKGLDDEIKGFIVDSEQRTKVNSVNYSCLNTKDCTATCVLECEHSVT